MSENPNPGGPPKSGVSTRQPRPTETEERPSPTGTLSFSENPNPGGPPKSGVSTQQPRPKPSNNQEEPKK